MEMFLIKGSRYEPCGSNNKMFSFTSFIQKNVDMMTKIEVAPIAVKKSDFNEIMVREILSVSGLNRCRCLDPVTDPLKDVLNQ